MPLDAEQRAVRSRVSREVAAFGGMEPEAPARAPDGAVTGSRRKALVVAGASIVVACTLLGAVVAARISHRAAYLALARAVPYGAILTRQDLSVIGLSASGALDAVAAAAIGHVIGMRANEPLTSGTLLSPGDLSSAPPMPATDALVGASLAPNQIPLGLEAGEAVLVVLSGSSPSPGTSSGALTDPTAQAEASGSAVAAEPARDDILASGIAYSLAVPGATAASNGEELVTLEVPRAVAAAVAAASAAGDVSLAEVPGQGR